MQFKMSHLHEDSTDSDHTQLSEAPKEGNYGYLMDLIQAGFKVNAVDEDGTSALGAILNDPDINFPDDYVDVDLVKQCIHLLLEAGADVNIRLDYKNNMPLMHISGLSFIHEFIVCFFVMVLG